MYPQNKFIQSQARQRGQVFPIERCPSCQRGREQVRQGDDKDVGVSVLALDVEKAFGASAPRLINGDKWLRRQVMLANERSDEPRHHIRTAARASRDDQFHRFLGFPGRDAAQPYEQDRQYTYHQCCAEPLFHVVLLKTYLQCRTPRCFSRTARLFRLEYFSYLYVRSRLCTSQGLPDFSLRETRRVTPPRPRAYTPKECTAYFQSFVASEAV